MKVKICGITNFEDGLMAIEKGADYLGIILDPTSKRCLSIESAAKLVKKLKLYSATVYGIFPEKDFNLVKNLALQIGLEAVQIVAPKDRAALKPLDGFQKLLVVPIEKEGSYQARDYALQKSEIWLYDSKDFGHGHTFDWNAFSQKESGHFLLAGGLTPGNVSRAIEILQPYGVDVSSGVCAPCNLKKDAILTERFIKEAHGSK